MKKEKKPVKIKWIAVICAAAVIVGGGLYFLLSPGYHRDLNEVTMVKPDWTQEMVILYEEDRFGNTRYWQEESEEYLILKFEPFTGSSFGISCAHNYYFRKDNGKLNHFGYCTDGDGRGCEHARALYTSILMKYGHAEDSTYCHLEAYNGMLGGKRYHVSVYQSDGMKNFSDSSVIDITFWPGW